MALSNNQKKEILSELERLKIELAEDIQSFKKSSQPVALDQQAVGRVSRVDSIQQQQMQLSSLRRLEQRLKLVEAALERVDSEEFGDCTQCEEPINFARLKARPEALLCIRCAK